MTESFPAFQTRLALGVGLFCFFFSGAAGLIYQVVWTRMLYANFRQYDLRHRHGVVGFHGGIGDR